MSNRVSGGSSTQDDNNSCDGLDAANFAAHYSEPLPRVVSDWKLCTICEEMFSDSSGMVWFRCGDMCCKTCFNTYVLGRAGNMESAISCPVCTTDLKLQDILSALTPADSAYEALERAIIENLHHNNIRYCSNPRCATPFDWLEDFSSCGGEEKFKVTCPLCHKSTCVNCRTEWHENVSCQEHDAQAVYSDPVRKLALQEDWTKCPRCGHLIERIGGCRIVICRCGCELCHFCGNAVKEGEYCTCAQVIWP